MFHHSEERLRKLGVAHPEDSSETLLWLFTTQRGHARKLRTNHLAGPVAIGQVVMASN